MGIGGWDVTWDGIWRRFVGWDGGGVMAWDRECAMGFGVGMWGVG